MAACADLEVEEKSLEESSCNIIRANGSAFCDASSTTCYSVSRDAINSKEPRDQLKVESETGDLKELSDDEFLHLLKEASTFNKPNNQESILLKQLRKEVAESDSCENASRSESSSKRAHRKCSNVVNSPESVVLSHGLTATSNSAPFPATAFKIFPRKTEKGKEVPPGGNSMLLNVSEAGYTKRPQVSHHVIEIEPGNDNWTLKAKKSYSSFSEASDRISKQVRECRDYSGKSSERDTASSFSSNSYVYDLNAFAVDQVGPGIDSKRELCAVSSHESSSSSAVQADKKAVPRLTSDGSGHLPNDQHMSENHTEQGSPSKELQDIELTEFRRSSTRDTKTQDKKETSSSSGSAKSQGCTQLSNSKFYMDCGEVDSTVTFPLKLVSSVDESGNICDPMNEQSKRQVNFPCFSWPPHTQPFVLNHGSLPMDHESSQSQSDSDGVGNPFSNRARTANITSFVSATLLDYPNSTLVSENQASKLELSHRKHKRTRNHADNTILSENIAGHRGNEDIDSLVKFIEAADKNDKTLTRSNANHVFSNKNNSSQDNFRRKVNGKDSKTNQNKPPNACKKKSLANADENSTRSDNSKSDCNKNVSSESELSDDSFATKNNNNKVSSPEHSATSPQLDINSNVVEDATRIFASKENSGYSTDVTVDGSVDVKSLEMSSFVSDFYTVTDAVSQAVEDSGFRIVKKKQRKKHQGKRSENYRWHTAAARAGQNSSGNHDYYTKEQAEHSSGMMLLPGMALSQRGQCSNQDSRRKSTSSVPHSEQSSADNSDLDSVHSLPVRGSAPHPTKVHPHTTPSSTSSTPQASYADIARMPVSATSKLSSPVTASGTPVPLTKAYAAAAVDRNPSHPDPVLCTVGEPNYANSVTPAAQEPEGNRDCAIKSVDSSSKSTREINTQTEPLVSADSVQLECGNVGIPARDLDKNWFSSSSKKTACAAPCKGKPCACSREEKPQPSLKQGSAERVQRPAVVMMGSIPTMEASDISFGIDLKEILQISSDGHEVSDSTQSSPTVNTVAPQLEHQLKHTSIPPASPDGSGVDSPCVKTNFTKSSFSADGSSMCKCDHASTFHGNASSPCNELFLSSGQRLRFREYDDINTELFNYSQIVELISREWKNVHKEYCSELNKAGDKVKYYENSC